MTVPPPEIDDLHLSMTRFDGEAHMLNGVDLAVKRGEIGGLVGETGCGKTTLTRLILLLDAPAAGCIPFEGQDMARLSPAAMRALRARIQIVFQDAFASLNPRMSVHDIVTEPMLIHRATLGLGTRARTDRRSFWRWWASEASTCTAIRRSSQAASASASASRGRWAGDAVVVQADPKSIINQESRLKTTVPTS